MRFVRIVGSRLRSLVLRRRREAELHEELQQHIDREAERLEATGLARQQARQQALRHFGGVEWAKDHCRDARGTAGVDSLMRDTRYAIRRLAHDWRFTAAAVLMLGVGVGANTAIFSLVNAALLRGHPLAEPERLVDIYQNASNPGGIDGNSYPAYLDMAARTDVFAATTAASVPRGVSYLDGGTLRPAVAEHTTASYLTVLGLQPTLGRWFTPAEDVPGAAVVAVLGHDAWTRKFAADPSVIGRTIRIESVPVTIVGVGPVAHRGTIDLGIVTDVWLPITSLPAFGAAPRALERRPEEAVFSVKARLRDGVSVAQAQAAMDVLATRLASEYPNEDPGRGIAVYASRDVRVHPQMDGLLRTVASIVLVVVGLVLGIACTNLATLLLVRGTARAKEMSVRLALGATRGQLVRHLLTENLLVATGGCLVGCLLAWWAIRSIPAIELPVALDVSLDLRVLAFAVVISLITGLSFGLAPALKATKVDLVSTLRGDGEARRQDSRWLTTKNMLVVLQVAASVLLLGSTSLFLQLLSASRSLHTGFAVDGVAIIETDPRYAGYSGPGAHQALEDLRKRVAAIPGVQAAALTRGLPMELTGVRVVVEGAVASAGPAGASRHAAAIVAGPGYFDVLRIPILFGRALDDRDRAGAPRVAVISDTMARQHFAVPDPAAAIGRRFRPELETDAKAWIEVVGVAADTRTSLVDPIPQVFYQSFLQSDGPPTTVLARTSLDAVALAGSMQREVRAAHAMLPIVAATTMAQQLEASLAATQAVATFLGALGALGLGLAGIGLYAVVAFAVARRSREIGIRMALGARRRQVVGTVARDVGVLVGVGTSLGLMLMLVAILALRAAVVSTPGISVYRPTVDPLALLTIAAFVAVVGVAAAAVPARRAATMDPLLALRRD